MSTRRGPGPKSAERVRDTCICLHAQRAARVMARRFDEALRPVRLTNEQFSLLMALNRAEAPCVRQIARLLGADRTTLTAALKRLVREGLAEVGADAQDARIRRVSLTLQGRERLGEAVPLWRRTHRALERELGDESLERLRRGLRDLGETAAP